MAKVPRKTEGKVAKEVILFNAATPGVDFLSAMYPSPFRDDKGRLWRCVEQYFQYHKLSIANLEDKKLIELTTELKEKILGSYDPFKMRYFGSQKAGGNMNPKWDKGLSDKVMLRAQRWKYEQNPLLLVELMQTRNNDLVEDAPWDAIWGSGKDGNGQNKSGKILMELRREFRTKIKSTTGLLCEILQAGDNYRAAIEIHFSKQAMQSATNMKGLRDV